MAAFGCRQRAFAAGKLGSRAEDTGLGVGTGFHIAVVIQFGHDGVHTVVAQAAHVVRGGDKAAA